jgi:hypothetical protein
MAYQLGTPFDNIESAREYVNQLLAATREAQAEIETELRRVTDPEVARREQALQLVKYKLQRGSELEALHWAKKMGRRRTACESDEMFWTEPDDLGSIIAIRTWGVEV